MEIELESESDDWNPDPNSTLLNKQIIVFTSKIYNLKINK